MRLYGRPPYGVAVVHGGPGAAGELAPVARELARARGVFEPLQSVPSVEGQIEELKVQLEALGAGPFILIGHSWGAWLACLLAAGRPALVKKLILVASGAFEQRHAEGLLERRLARLSGGEQDEARALAERARGAAPFSSEQLARFGELLFKADSYDPIPSGGDPVRCDARIFRTVWPEAVRLRETGELLRRVANLRCPVVALHGDHDPTPAQGVREPLSRVLKDFRMIVVERCGHSPWRERQARRSFFEALETELTPVS